MASLVIVMFMLALPASNIRRRDDFQDQWHNRVLEKQVVNVDSTYQDILALRSNRMDAFQEIEQARATDSASGLPNGTAVR